MAPGNNTPACKEQSLACMSASPDHPFWSSALLSLIQSLHRQVQLPKAAKHIPVLSTKAGHEIQLSESVAVRYFLCGVSRYLSFIGSSLPTWLSEHNSDLESSGLLSDPSWKHDLDPVGH